MDLHNYEADKFLLIQILIKTTLQKEDVNEQEIGSYSNAPNRGYYDGQEGTPTKDGGIITSQGCRTVSPECSIPKSWMA